MKTKEQLLKDLDDRIDSFKFLVGVCKESKGSEDFEPPSDEVCDYTKAFFRKLLELYDVDTPASFITPDGGIQCEYYHDEYDCVLILEFRNDGFVDCRSYIFSGKDNFGRTNSTQVSYFLVNNYRIVDVCQAIAKDFEYYLPKGPSL